MTEFTTSASATDAHLAGTVLAGEETSWQGLASQLPQDLEASAKASEALPAARCSVKRRRVQPNRGSRYSAATSQAGSNTNRRAV